MRYLLRRDFISLTDFSLFSISFLGTAISALANFSKRSCSGFVLGLGVLIFIYKTTLGRLSIKESYLITLAKSLSDLQCQIHYSDVQSKIQGSKFESNFKPNVNC